MNLQHLRKKISLGFALLHLLNISLLWASDALTDTVRSFTPEEREKLQQLAEGAYRSNPTFQLWVLEESNHTSSWVDQDQLAFQVLRELIERQLIKAAEQLARLHLLSQELKDQLGQTCGKKLARATRKNFQNQINHRAKTLITLFNREILKTFQKASDLCTGTKCIALLEITAQELLQVGTEDFVPNDQFFMYVLNELHTQSIQNLDHGETKFLTPYINDILVWIQSNQSVESLFKQYIRLSKIGKLKNKFLICDVERAIIKSELLRLAQNRRRVTRVFEEMDRESPKKNRVFKEIP